MCRQYRKGYQTGYHNAQGGIEMRRHGSQCLAANDAVDNEVALHSQDIEHTRHDGSVVSVNSYKSI